MVQCDTYKMGTRQHCKGHKKLKREADDTNYQCEMYVTCLTPTNKQTQDHKEPVEL